MLLACWSVKGGSGTTVVASALALLIAKSAPDGALLVDLAGDIDSVLGLTSSDSFGITDWLASDTLDPNALAGLEVAVDESLTLLRSGRELGLNPAVDLPERALTLATALARDHRPVIVDCGSAIGQVGAPSIVAKAIAAAASNSLLVIRPCFLAVQRAILAPIRPSGIVLVHEPGRSLRRSDIESALQVPVRAEVELDPAVARSVDAGLLSSRIPRALARSLRHAA